MTNNVGSYDVPDPAHHILDIQGSVTTCEITEGTLVASVTMGKARP